MDTSKVFIDKRSESLNNITTPKGIMLRMTVQYMLKEPLVL